MSLVYIVKEGLSGFRRARLAAAGSIITVVIALLLVGVFYVVSSNTSRIMHMIRERVEMEAFLEEPLSRQQVSELQQKVLAVEGIDHVQFISKEDAAKIFKQEFGEDVNSVLQFNPLPPSFKIFLKEPYRTTGKADEIQKSISAIKGIDTVMYRKDMLSFIEKQTQTLDTLGFALGILIGISAIFLVSNTIRLTISAKQKSIQTMKLVGASWWFVRAPFLIEGIIQGLIGGIIAGGILFYASTAAAGFLSPDLLEFIHVDPTFYVLVALSGSLLGLFGSALSVKRFIGDSIGT